MKYSITLGGRKFNVEVNKVEGRQVTVTVNGVLHTLNLDEPIQAVSEAGPPPPAPGFAKDSPSFPPPDRSVPASTMDSGFVTAPIPGKILEVRVNVGDAVEAGQILAVMEAMKMENNITAPTSGAITEIRVQKGSDVATGDVIMIIG
jgi:glutaconyl-CoA decarboxylase